MKRLLSALMLCATLSACGGSPEAVQVAAPPPVLAQIVNPDAITKVTINEDYRQGDPSGEYLVNVSFSTAHQELNVEYCDTPVHVGDIVRLEPYGIGTTLIYVNDVMVGNLIDWEATEKAIMEFKSDN